MSGSFCPWSLNPVERRTGALALNPQCGSLSAYSDENLDVDIGVMAGLSWKKCGVDGDALPGSGTDVMLPWLPPWATTLAVNAAMCTAFTKAVLMSAFTRRPLHPATTNLRHMTISFHSSCVIKSGLTFCGGTLRGLRKGAFAPFGTPDFVVFVPFVSADFDAALEGFGAMAARERMEVCACWRRARGGKSSGDREK